MNTQYVINPTREKGEPVLDGTGLLVVNPSEARLAVEHGLSHGGKRHFIFNSNLVQIPLTADGGPFFIAGPSVGAPMAAMTLEKLMALGAQTVVIFGWCGSLSPDLTIGDVLLPVWAESEEGTSKHYTEADAKPEADSELRSSLKLWLLQKEIHVTEAPVWTTDAPYRETRHAVEAYAKKGVLAVDMEFSALCAVAATRKVRIAAAFVVSDELWGETWKSGFRTRKFKDQRKLLLASIMDFCANYETFFIR
ncbi:MAG: nucleoside phosphorylase [Proteobacteria bacterium]|nr:nucleoside phosphorylase [Pseudomonadota bacterium]MBU1708585.1 nucleoside phosphorylase [Pseudomonadota bacterium]